MAKVPYINANGPFSVRVQLENASNVFLVNESNYQKYRNGQRFQYYGGHYRSNPVTISTTGHGRFYLVVETGAYKYSFY